MHAPREVARGEAVKGEAMKGEAVKGEAISPLGSLRCFFGDRSKRHNCARIRVPRQPNELTGLEVFETDPALFLSQRSLLVGRKQHLWIQSNFVDLLFSILSYLFDNNDAFGDLHQRCVHGSGHYEGAVFKSGA